VASGSYSLLADTQERCNGKDTTFNLWATDLVWGDNLQPQAQCLKATAILIACMCIFVLALFLLMDRPAIVSSGLGQIRQQTRLLPVKL
jgi:hypothetical protein